MIDYKEQFPNEGERKKKVVVKKKKKKSDRGIKKTADLQAF